MDIKNMKKIIRKAFKEERKREKMQDEINNPKKTFIAATVAVIAIGVLFLTVIAATLVHMDDVVKNAPATRYNLNCLVEVKDRPLEECRK